MPWYLDAPQAWWHKVPKWSAFPALVLPSWQRRGLAKFDGKAEMCSAQTWIESWPVLTQFLWPCQAFLSEAEIVCGRPIWRCGAAANRKLNWTTINAICSLTCWDLKVSNGCTDPHLIRLPWPGPFTISLRESHSQSVRDMSSAVWTVLRLSLLLAPLAQRMMRPATAPPMKLLPRQPERPTPSGLCWSQPQRTALQSHAEAVGRCWKATGGLLQWLQWFLHCYNWLQLNNLRSRIFFDHLWICFRAKNVPSTFSTSSLGFPRKPYFKTCIYLTYVYIYTVYISIQYYTIYIYTYASSPPLKGWWYCFKILFLHDALLCRVMRKVCKICCFFGAPRIRQFIWAAVHLPWLCVHFLFEGCGWSRRR